MCRWLVDVDGLLAAHLVPLHVPLKLLVLVREDELVGQMILIEVIDQVPEALLVQIIAAEPTQVHLEVPISVQFLANVLVEHGCTLELSFELSVTSLCDAALVSHSTNDLWIGPVDLLTDRDLEVGLGDLVPAESADDDCVAKLVLDCISDCLSELGGEKLALAVVAFLLELKPHLLTVDLIADSAVAVRGLEGALTEVQLVTYLAAQL